MLDERMTLKHNLDEWMKHLNMLDNRLRQCMNYE